MRSRTHLIAGTMATGMVKGFIVKPHKIEISGVAKVPAIKCVLLLIY